MEYVSVGILLVSVLCLGVGLAFGALAGVMRLMTALPAVSVARRSAKSQHVSRLPAA